jgi:hypothetical protein
LLAAGLLLAVGAFAAAAVAIRPAGLTSWRRQPAEAARYPSADDCARCHPDQADAWRTSAHAFGGHNILVHASVCGPCHAPVGTQLEPEYLFKTTSGASMRALPESAGEGVTCIACHAKVHAPDVHVMTLIPVWPNWDTSDLALRLESSDTAYGPFGGGGPGDPPAVTNEAHSSVADARLESAATCRPCHDVTLDKGPLAEQAGGPQPLVPLLTTFREWQDSPYAPAGRTCQSCHMPRAPAMAPAAVAPPGTSYDRNLPDRPRADHALLGPDSAYWDPTAPRAEQEKRAEGLLATAADVAIAVPNGTSPGSTLTVTVTLRNVGAGHDLPTGFGFWREAWLELVATDARGRKLFSSGELDADGWLSDEFSPRVRQDPSLYDPYLVQLRTRLVRSPANLAAWLQPDRTVTVPRAAIRRNRNGTPILSWSEFDVADVVAGIEAATGAPHTPPSPLEDVYTLRYAEALVRNGIPAGGSRTATYPVVVPPDAIGPLRLAARLLLRPMGRHMTQQQEELSADPPAGPVYEMGAAYSEVALTGE